MKIDFAPVDVPVHRRLQTAAVLQWVYSFLGLGEYMFILYLELKLCVNMYVQY